MDFLSLQTELADLTLDSSAAWIAWGTSNKAAINAWFKELRNRIKNAEVIKRKITVNKTQIDITDYIGTLPTDFDSMDLVAVCDFDAYSDVYELSSDIYYDWKVIWLGTVTSPYKIMLNDNFTPVYVRYIPIITALVDNSDVPDIPMDIHRSIVDFALVEYYRRIRDSIEVANNLVLSQQYLDQRMSTLS